MKLFIFFLFAFSISLASCAQPDKSKRPSPPANVSETMANRLVITIDYSQPSVKGRSIGVELAPFGKYGVQGPTRQLHSK